MNREEVVKYARKSLLDELYSKEIYSKMGELHKGKSPSKKLIKISRMEEGHARFWRKFLEKRGVATENLKVNKFKLFLQVLLLRLLGISLSLRILELSENNAVNIYARLLESEDIDDDEKRGLKKILEDELLHEEELAEEESLFQDFIDHVRDAVLGMSDGLVEILSVSAGLAGAYGSPFHVALGSTIVGIAGALSMGISTYTSVKAQRQVRQGILARVKLASKYVAEVFVSRISEYMKRKGFSRETADRISKEASENQELLGKMISEEEYGLKEEALENPVKAGLYTGIFYIMGALIPLTPYYLGLNIGLGIPLSFMIAAIMLAMTGFIIALVAKLPLLRKMIELVIAGLGAATITFIIGMVASIFFGISVT